jgi:hypothetical protein
LRRLDRRCDQLALQGIAVMTASEVSALFGLERQKHGYSYGFGGVWESRGFPLVRLNLGAAF